VGTVRTASRFSDCDRNLPDLIECLEMACCARRVSPNGCAAETLWRTLIADVSDAKPRQCPAPSEYGGYFATWLAAKLARSIASSNDVGKALKRAQALVAGILDDEPCWNALRRLDAHFNLMNPEDTSSAPSRPSDTKAKTLSLSDSSVRQLESTEGYYLYNRAVNAASRGGRVFLSSNAYLGVGRSNTCVADEIWLLEGARVPFVLRRFTSYEPIAYEEALRNARWLVSEAYARGIMHGEWACYIERFTEDVDIV
jgi:hypothetical protein